MPFGGFHIDVTTIYAIGAALGFLVLDWILGIAVSLKAGTFNIGLAPRQLETLIAANLAGLGFGGLLQALTSGGLSVALVAFVAAAAATSSGRSILDIYAKVLALGGQTALNTPPTVVSAPATPATPPAANPPTSLRAP